MSEEYIKNISEKGNAIIVGRGANSILKEYNPINIFVYANMESKINRCKQKADSEENLTDKEIGLEKKKVEINLSEHFTYKKLIKFTLPTIIMMVFTSIYGVVDGIFVSNVVENNAFASINLIMPAIMIIGTIGFMIGTGGSAIISKTLGEGKKEEANKQFSMLIYLEIISGVIFTIIVIALLRPIAKLLGATEEIMSDCLTYGRILLIGMTAFILQNSFQSFMVVAEKLRFGLGISIAAGITNMVLDFLLIYVFRLGVAGAAIATITSQTVGAIIPLIYFSRKNDTMLKLGKTKFELSTIIKTCTNGSSEMVTNLSMSLVNILFNMQVMKIAGANGVSAYGIIMYVGFLFVGTYMGYSVGTVPTIGYHYGAGNKDELKSLLSKSLKLLGIIAIIMTGLAEILAKPLASIFVSYDKELLEITINAIRLYSLSYIISWFNIFTSSFFIALNNGFISALISFLRTLLFQVAMILILPAVWGINGIWLSVVVAELLAIVVSIICIVANRKKYEYA